MSQPHPNGISIGSIIFAQVDRMPNTQTVRQTQIMLRATHEAIGRIYALRQPKKKASEIKLKAVEVELYWSNKWLPQLIPR